MSNYALASMLAMGAIDWLRAALRRGHCEAPTGQRIHTVFSQGKLALGSNSVYNLITNYTSTSNIQPYHIIKA